MNITPQMIKDHKLTQGEYDHAVAVLGREPTWPELGVISVMWSEHCSYKSSRMHLRRLPTTGPGVVIGPGENAGAVDIGDGQCAIFKMESHNHPSYIEPYQGAATGVGGILRDVFTMGARPIAALNSLRFGDPGHARTRGLLHGVVAGIGGYGNCFGVPTVGGEVMFHPSYDGNCLVNAFVVGIVKEDRIFLGTAAGPGNPVIYVGARTGRDGIHGATMASDEFSATGEKRRPTVQVGDPFQEKLLLEACLELMGSNAIVGIQDMGAAGLTSSSVEMAGRAGNGLLLDLDQIPVRETGMTPYELLLSESQERMLMVVERGREAEVLALFDKWDLQAAVVGKVTEDGIWRCRWHGEDVCAIPVPLLTDEAPKYDRPRARPDWADTIKVFTEPACADPSGDLVRLMASPDLCSRAWVYRQYDHQVGASTAVLPGADAAVVRVRGGSEKALGLVVDCNSRHVLLDPRAGAVGVIAECARNLACVGARPVGATDCLNFGNPERPEVMWQFSEAVDGLAEGCRGLGVPIVSGNVSLYNETDGKGVLPTPSVAMVGLIDGPIPTVRARFARAGLEVALLGEPAAHGVGGSVWLSWLHGLDRGAPPPVSLAKERSLHATVRWLVRKGIVEVAHDLSDGGLAVGLAEACIGLREQGNIGVEAVLPGTGSPAGRLFGEDHGRVIVAYDPARAAEVLAVAGDVTVTVLGKTGGDRLKLGPVDVAVADLRAAWDEAMPRYAAGAPWPKGS
jgi:phosphoribosylformylglycinamidine synthase II